MNFGAHNAVGVVRTVYWPPFAGKDESEELHGVSYLSPARYSKERDTCVYFFAAAALSKARAPLRLFAMP